MVYASNKLNLLISVKVTIAPLHSMIRINSTDFHSYLGVYSYYSDFALMLFFLNNN